MKTIINISIIYVLLIGFHSCGLIFREVKCRNFEFHDELKWFAGSADDVITFSNKENETKEFKIVKKYIDHRIKYISDTGCGCHDWWGVLLSAGNDTIDMYSHSRYVETNPAAKYDYFIIKYNNKLSVFTSENKSIVANYTIENKMFAQVLIIEYSHTETNQFKKIVIAPEIGIIELTETNGNVWKKIDIETKLKIDLSSFEYRETTCD